MTLGQICPKVLRVKRRDRVHEQGLSARWVLSVRTNKVPLSHWFHDIRWTGVCPPNVPVGPHDLGAHQPDPAPPGARAGALQRRRLVTIMQPPQPPPR